MFAYCLNRPVSYADSSGYISYTCFGDDFLLSDQMLNVDGGGGIERPTITTSQQESKKIIQRELWYWKSGYYDQIENAYGVFQIISGVKKISGGTKTLILYFWEPTIMSETCAGFQIVSGMYQIIKGLSELFG